ncbi:hypothetical protein IWQ61_008168, partial [Dispira simplex]
GTWELEYTMAWDPEAVNPSTIKVCHLTPQRRQRLLKCVKLLTRINAHQVSRRRGTPRWTVTTPKPESIHSTTNDAPDYDETLLAENPVPVPMTSTALLPKTVKRIHVLFDETGRDAQLKCEYVCNDTAELEAMYKEDSEFDQVGESSMEDDDDSVGVEMVPDRETADGDAAAISQAISSEGSSATSFESVTSGSSDDEPTELPVKPTVSMGGQMWITYCEHGDRVEPNWRNHRSIRRKYVAYPVEIAYQQQQERLQQQECGSPAFELASDPSSVDERGIVSS